MKKHNFRKQSSLYNLVNEYEEMTQKGLVSFMEKNTFLQLIDHYEHESNAEKALEVIDYAIQQHCYSSEFFIRKSNLLINLGKPNQALDCLDKAALFAPSALEIQLFRVDILKEIDLQEEAIEVLDSLKPNVSKQDLSNIYLAEAMVIESLDDYGAMFHALRKSVLADPENTEALERMWFCVELSEKYHESIDLHKRLIDINPYSALAWYNLGHAYTCVEQFEYAIEAYEYAFIINEDFEFAYRDCGEVCIQIKQYKRALKYYSEAMERFEPDCDLLTKIGKCYEYQDLIEQAKSYYKQALKIDPYHDAVHYRLGCCMSKEEKWQSAVIAYQQAIELNERAEEYHAGLGEAYFQLDKPKLAAEAFQKATEYAPEQSKYWIQYASFLMEIEETYAALSVLDDADEHANGVELTYSRVACLFGLGERNEGLRILGSALEQNFDLHKVLFTLMPALSIDLDVMYMIETYRNFNN